jgi:hypothetical protein
LSNMRKRPVFQGRAHYTPRRCRLSSPCFRSSCRACHSAGAVRFFSVEWKRQFAFLRFLGFSTQTFQL